MVAKSCRAIDRAGDRAGTEAISTRCSSRKAMAGILRKATSVVSNGDEVDILLIDIIAWHRPGIHSSIELQTEATLVENWSCWR